MKALLFLLFTIVSIARMFAQSNNSPNNSYFEIDGIVLDEVTKTPLAFTNIGIMSSYRGTVSNENGQYLLYISDIDITDTVSFHYIGYKVKRITISDLLKDSVVLLQEDIVSISEFIVYGNDIDAKSIVEKVLPNREKNYKPSPQKLRVFIRNRYVTDIYKFKVTPLKNSFNQLDDNTARLIEKSVPKQELSFTDYYGDVYSNNDISVDYNKRTKLSPLKIISLKDNQDYSEIETTFEDLFNDTQEKEYWKVASGVFSTKVNLENDSVKSDTNYKVEDYKNTMSSWFLAKQINRGNRFLSMDNEDSWEFLHNTGKYIYTLFGGTRIKGEDVYIIDFVAKRRGSYHGRLYISCNTYAIIKADFEYAEGKTGVDVNMLGISYMESVHKVTLFYENHDGVYHLKYLFRQEGEILGVNRKVELIKKRERFLLDKTVAKYKVKLSFRTQNLNSIEILIIKDKSISINQFNEFKSKERLKVQYVNEFDDKMWDGYSIIAPTQQMREYHKK